MNLFARNSIQKYIIHLKEVVFVTTSSILTKREKNKFLHRKQYRLRPGYILLKDDSVVLFWNGRSFPIRPVHYLLKKAMKNWLRVESWKEYEQHMFHV